MPKRTIDIDVHHSSLRIFDKRPMNPSTLQLAGRRRLIDAIVSSIMPTIPIDTTVAPRNVDIQFALIRIICGFEQGCVDGQDILISSQPTLHGDRGVKAHERHWINFHSIVPVHSNEAR